MAKPSENYYVHLVAVFFRLKTQKNVSNLYQNQYSTDADDFEFIP